MLYIYDVGGNVILLCARRSTDLLPLFLKNVYYDQLIIWDQSGSSVSVEILNRDGSIALQCGNGLSALAKHLKQTVVDIYIGEKKYRAKYENQRFWVEMGAVLINQVSDILFEVNAGNKHIISLNDNAQLIDHQLMHKWQKTHNISRICQFYPHHIGILTFERGCGYTGSCASASTAACAVLHQIHNKEPSWLVSNPSGLIQVTYNTSAYYQSGSPTLIKTLI
ncbi:hypothetical protein OAT84_00445 [Gammaproteobacteria bacterium]|nr:hypothetical protein [Gammaproteobacteria bacterium]